MAQVLVDVKGHKGYNLMSCDSKLREFQGEGTENGLKVMGIITQTSHLHNSLNHLLEDRKH